jgi:hypothetical protein
MTEAEENTAHHRVLAEALGISVKELHRLGALDARHWMAVVKGQKGHVLGRSHEWTSDEARAAQRKTGRIRYDVAVNE